MNSETIHADGLAFELRRSPRRRTLGLTVDRGGELVAHAPEAVSIEEIHDFIGSKLLWVHQKLAEKEASLCRIRPPEFVTGETIFYLGNAHRLAVVKGGGEPVRFDGTRFLIRAGNADANRIFRKWYIGQGKELLPRRVEWYQSRITTRPRSVRVRNLGFRWGSCSARGGLNFNWMLLQLPMRLIDYVVVHEMAHLVVPNHSLDFWKFLRSVMPDCMERKEELARAAKRFMRFDVYRAATSVK